MGGKGSKASVGSTTSSSFNNMFETMIASAIKQRTAGDYGGGTSPSDGAVGGGVTQGVTRGTVATGISKTSRDTLATEPTGYDDFGNPEFGAPTNTAVDAFGNAIQSHGSLLDDDDDESDGAGSTGAGGDAGVGGAQDSGDHY